MGLIEFSNTQNSRCSTSPILRSVNLAPNEGVLVAYHVHCSQPDHIQMQIGRFKPKCYISHDMATAGAEPKWIVEIHGRHSRPNSY
eukprot:scaffold244242_cov22-Prasinocladus_malaysianus.AAC.1